MKRTHCVLVVCLFLLSLQQCFAQLEVTLENGSTLRGTRSGETTNSLTLNVFIEKSEDFRDVVLNKARITRVYDLAADEEVTDQYIPGYAQAMRQNTRPPGTAPEGYHCELTGDAAWQTIPETAADEANRSTLGTGLFWSSVPLLQDDEHRTDASKVLQRKSWASVGGRWGPYSAYMPSQFEYRAEGALQLGDDFALGPTARYGKMQLRANRSSNGDRYRESGTYWSLGALADMYFGRIVHLRELIALGAREVGNEDGGNDSYYYHYYRSAEQRSSLLVYEHSLHIDGGKRFDYSHYLRYSSSDKSLTLYDFVHRFELAPSAKLTVTPQLRLAYTDRYSSERIWTLGLGAGATTYVSEYLHLRMRAEYLLNRYDGRNALDLQLAAGLRW